jgi:hypothetical protein
MHPGGLDSPPEEISVDAMGFEVNGNCKAGSTLVVPKKVTLAIVENPPL